MLLACGLFAQSWDGLNGLRPGEPVRVVDTNRVEHSGTFTAVSPTAISLHTRKGEVSVERTRVRRVQIRSTSRRLRNALIGAAIGVAVGLTVDQTLGARLRNESDESGRTNTYFAPIALFGGLAGAFPAYRTVYKGP
jgi:hypothetical protein